MNYDDLVLFYKLTQEMMKESNRYYTKKSLEANPKFAETGFLTIENDSIVFNDEKMNDELRKTPFVFIDKQKNFEEFLQKAKFRIELPE